jgi:hypothetical protein
LDKSDKTYRIFILGGSAAHGTPKPEYGFGRILRALLEESYLAKDLFFRLEGGVRVTDDSIIVTYYNAPNAELIQSHYHNLPQKFAADHIDSRVPWLYNYKLYLRFR